MKYKIILTAVHLLAVTFSINGEISTDTIIINDSKELKLIGKHIAFFEDTSSNLTILEILKPENQEKFILHKNKVFTHQPSSSAYWFKFTLANLTGEELWFEAGGFYSTWFVELHQPDSLGQYANPVKQKAFGETDPNWHSHGFHWFKLAKCSKKSTQTFYLRIKSGVAPELPFYVGTHTALDSKRNAIFFITFSFFGVMAIMFLYNLFLFFITKDKIYLSYIFFVFANAVCFAFNNNFHILGNSSWWWEKHIAWQFLGDLSSIIFIIHFLNLRKSLPIAFKIYLVLIIVDLLLASLNLFGVQTVYLIDVYTLLSLLLVPVTIFSGVYLLINKQQNALIFMISWSFFLISLVVFILVINGLLPYNTFTRYSVYLGLAVEATLFSMALADRLRTIRKEKESVLEENIKLVNNYNKLLEKEVKKKTADLTYKNQKLNAVLENANRLNEQISKQNNELQELNKYKEEMTNMIVHDLKNPLNAIIGLAENELVKESGRRMLNLVMNILDVYKNTEAKLTIDKNNYLLLNIAKATIKEVLFLAKKKNILIETEISNEIIVNVDIEIIKRVFINILNNAIKFTPYNGKVSIKSEKIITKSNETKKVKVIITDTGKGIPEDKIPLVFKRFAQADRAPEDARSTGIGLTFCKIAIEAHEGEIGVVSKEGKGATFWFTLPISKDDSTTKEEKESKNEEVCLVDEEQEYLKKMLTALSKLEFYEAGEIFKVIKKYNTGEYLNVQEYADKIKNAVFSGNLAEYEKLLYIA